MTQPFVHKVVFGAFVGRSSGGGGSSSGSGGGSGSSGESTISAIDLGTTPDLNHPLACSFCHVLASFQRPHHKVRTLCEFGVVVDVVRHRGNRC